jgi:hypothetical protein
MKYSLVNPIKLTINFKIFAILHDELRKVITIFFPKLQMANFSAELN